jgi:hypothetical protein
VSRTMPKKTQQKPMAFRFPKNQPLHPTSFMHWLCLAWYGKKHRCTDDMLNSIWEANAVRDGKVNLSMFLRRNTRVGSAVGITLRVARQQNKSQNEACWRVE